MHLRTDNSYLHMHNNICTYIYILRIHMQQHIYIYIYICTNILQGATGLEHKSATDVQKIGAPSPRKIQQSRWELWYTCAHTLIYVSIHSQMKMRMSLHPNAHVSAKRVQHRLKKKT